jgi:hypothetical protein
MYIHKLKYTNKETAITDLIAKGIYTENSTYGEGVQAIVELGVIVNTYGEFDDEGNEITPTTYLDGYHFDIMISQELVFEDEVQTNNPKHVFA